MRAKSLLGLQKLEPFKSKKTKQGKGHHSKPKKGHKTYRGQGK